MIQFSRYVPSNESRQDNKVICTFPYYEITKKGLIKRFKGSILPEYVLQWGVKYKDKKVIEGFYMTETLRGVTVAVEPVLANKVFSIGRTLEMLIPDRLERVGKKKTVTTTDFYRMVLLSNKIEGYLDGLDLDYTIKGKDKAGKFSVIDIVIPQFIQGEIMVIELRNLSREQILEYTDGFNIKVKGKPYSVLRAEEVLSLLQSLRTKIE